MTDHPLGPATYHRLAKLLSYQLANQREPLLRRIPFFAPHPIGY